MGPTFSEVHILPFIYNAMNDIPIGYRIIQQLGTGFGSVVLLCARPDGTQVCLKNVHIDGMLEYVFLVAFFFILQISL